MPIKVQCDSCKKPMRAPDHWAGKRARCRCGAVVVIPESEPEPMPAELDLTLGLPPERPSFGEPGPTASAQRPASVCPNCLADLAPGSVLCTACGFHLQSGRLLSVSTSEDRPAAVVGTPSGKPAPSRKASSAGSGLVVVGILMTVLKWAVVIGVVGGIAYAVHQGLSFNPRKQAQDAKNKVYPNMTVQQVVDAIGSPPAYVGVLVYEDKPGSPFSLPKEKHIPYQKDFVANVDPKLIQGGFFLVYRFTERDILAVAFDSDGKAEGAEIVDPMKPLGL